MADNVIGLPIRRASATQQSFWMTPTAEAIMHGLSWCQETGEMGLMIGAPGIGKSVSLTHYAAKGKRVYCVEANPDDARPIEFTRTLAAAINRRVHSDTLDERSGDTSAHSFRPMRLVDASFASILAFLTADDDAARPLLVVDECQWLRGKGFDVYRYLYDQGRGAFGFMLLGNPGMTEELRVAQKKNSSAGRAEVAMVPLKSRVKFFRDFGGASAGDVEAICDHYRVAGARTREALHRLASGAGGLRHVVTILQDALAVSGAGKAIGAPEINNAATRRNA